MERVVFLIEGTDERIPCLLNPESLVLRRTAGVRTRRSIGGALTGAARSDDPLVYTGGGRTELVLDLLFDVSLAIEPEPPADVRELTGRLWALAENATGDDGWGQLRVARFVWGRSFNIPGVVTAVAERLEHFTAEGAARRSWLRMRFVRVMEPSSPAAPEATTRAGAMAPAAEAGSGAAARVLEIAGVADASEGTEGEPSRPDSWAAALFGDASEWRRLFGRTPVADPLRVPAGTVLDVPGAGEAESR